jgi:spore coat protein A, manganese oxidase
MNRRKFVKVMGAAGAAAIIPWRFSLKDGWQAGAAYAAVNSPGLPLWGTQLRMPGAGTNDIPVMSSLDDPFYGPNTRFYQVGIGEFSDVIAPQIPNVYTQTKLWGYFDRTHPVQKHLGGIIVATRKKPSRIRFTNTLTSDGSNTGTPLNSIIPVDTTILGANQATNRTAIHLHGGFIPWICDGGPFDWFSAGIPNRYANGSSFLNGPGSVLDNIPGMLMVNGQADYYYPNDQSLRMMWYHDHAWGITRTNAYAGLATGYVLLDGTAFQVDAGGGFNSFGVPIVAGRRYIPLVIQDKVFIGPNFVDPTWPITNSGLGDLWYAHTYDPKLYKLNLRGKNKATLPPVSCVPEFFADTMLANGTVFPHVTVEAGRYRFQVLNACNARFLNLQLYQDNTLLAGGSKDGITLNAKTLAPTNPKGPNFILLGTEGGLLPAAVEVASNNAFNPVTLGGSLILAPAERADIMIDFSGLAGQSFILYSDAPAPFPVGSPLFDYLPNGLGTGPNTREIMRFDVVAAASQDPVPATPLVPIPVGGGFTPGTTSLAPYNDTFLVTPGATVTGTGINAKIVTPASTTTTRYLTLNEAFDTSGRLLQAMGTNVVFNAALGFGRAYLDPVTETVTAGTTEVWKIVNLTGDTHPIHFHLVNVQILARQPVKVNQYNGVYPLTYLGGPVMPGPDEWGWKETVRMNPGEEITVAMTFTLPSVPFTIPTSPRANAIPYGTPGSTLEPQDTGLGAVNVPGGNVAHEYVYHCHILEHEEHDMMRPLVVVGPANPA